MNTTIKSLSHSKYNCNYHIVFVPKFRKKTIFGEIRGELGIIFKELARQKECEIIEGHTVQDHVHMLISIPPKYSIASIIGYIKGKSAIAIARKFGRKRNFNGENFWARGYMVSTIGLEKDCIRAYIQNQEQLDSEGFNESGNF